MLGYASYVAKEMKDGCNDNIFGLWQLVRHPATSLSEMGQAVCHPISTVQNLSDFATEHPWRFATNMGFSILQGRAIACANVHHPMLNRIASATTSPIIPDPSSHLMRATLQNNTPNMSCTSRYTPSYDSKLKTNSNTPNQTNLGQQRCGCLSNIHFDSRAGHLTSTYRPLHNTRKCMLVNVKLY